MKNTYTIIIPRRAVGWNHFNQNPSRCHGAKLAGVWAMAHALR
jgi:hypothetical protein